MSVTGEKTELISPGVWQYVGTFAATTANGSSFQMARAAHITMQVTGTFNSAVVVLEGSNDNSNFVALQKDATTDAFTFSAAGILAVPRKGIGFRHYRATHATGNATTALVVRVIGSQNAG